ncbi:hypothetical protein ETI08_01215 [Macrococcoides goetzii]|nr:hypothetical protein [Macrococcus goetzii]TDM47782.1 hypothetical protein ETI08_01215 [Macrococcus goetzii]
MKIAFIIGAQLIFAVIEFAIAFTVGVAVNLSELSIVTLASLMSVLSALCLIAANKEVFNV